MTGEDCNVQDRASDDDDRWFDRLVWEHGELTMRISKCVKILYPNSGSGCRLDGTDKGLLVEQLKAMRALETVQSFRISRYVNRDRAKPSL